LSLGKKDIVKNIKSKARITSNDSKSLLDRLLYLIKDNHMSKIKITGFGSFQTHITPERLGRNPKTKEKFVISSRRKLSFKPSNSVKKILN
jgi:nucleoid DNA-binding protein